MFFIIRSYGDDEITCNLAQYIFPKIRRYNEETKFPVTPSFVLMHSSDSI